MADSNGNVTISKAWLAALGTILAALLAVGGVVWNASSRLQQMQDKLEELQRVQAQEQQDLAAIKSAFFVPNIAQRENKK